MEKLHLTVQTLQFETLQMRDIMDTLYTLLFYKNVFRRFHTKDDEYLTMMAMRRASEFKD